MNIFLGLENRKPSKKIRVEAAESLKVKEVHCLAHEKLVKKIGAKESRLKSLLESRNLEIFDPDSAETISRRFEFIS